MSNDADVIIIGAGPIGIELAVAIKQAGISYLQFDKGQVSQMVYNYPPGTPFFSSAERISIAGTPIQQPNQQKCLRETYLEYIRSITLAHKLKVNSFEQVTEIQKDENGFRVTTPLRSYHCRFVVIATGGTSYPKLLGVDGESLPHVSTRMDDPHKYFQKKVVIIGGRNSAAENALRLYQVGAHVALVVRSSELNPTHIKYWLLPELLGRIDHKEIQCYYSTEVVEIGPQGIVLKQADKIFNVDADFIIKSIGFIADMHLCKHIGVNLIGESQRPQFDEHTMETNVPGIFVAGTVIGGTQSKYRVFIENSHEHVVKILRKICGELGVNVPEVKIGSGARVYVPPVRLEE